MKKGFTLIEIIGALAILSILALIAVPAIQNAINNSNDTVYEAQIDLIIDASKNWIADHLERLPKKDKDKVGVTLLELKKGGYIDKEIKNPKTRQPFSDDLLVVITKENEYFRYEIKEESDLAPTLLLIGSENVYLNYGQEYQEPGVVAKKNNGEEIEEVTTIIKKNDEVVEEVDPTQYGIYTITYQVSDSGIVVTVKRNVHIIDNEPPVILFAEEETLLDVTVSSFDSLEGVTIEDNSGENVKVEVTGNLSLGITGTYYLTYRAIDSSGNVSKKIRTIQILILEREFLFSYENEPQPFEAPYTGIYQIELWGAKGGNGYSTYIRTAYSYGANGAYTKGVVSLKEGDTLYITTGGSGANSTTDKNSLGLIDGGYNGGGTGRSWHNGNSYVHNGAGGGGATHVALETGLLSTFSSKKNKVLMVAAGGGGGGGHEGSDSGGVAGGLTGGNGYRAQWDTNTGGTQTSGGISGAGQSSAGSNGTFGAGGNCATSGGGGGGGAGYFGGAGGQWNAGGGGSSYINGHSGCTTNNTDYVFTQTVMKAGNEEMPTFSGTGVTTGNSGDGYAKITFLGME